MLIDYQRCTLVFGVGSVELATSSEKEFDGLNMNILDNCVAK